MTVQSTYDGRKVSVRTVLVCHRKKLQGDHKECKHIRGSAVAQCLTRDREAEGSSLTGVTALWSLSKTLLS